MDLGLPSGTLWLDRLIGAKSASEYGLFYQWGDIVGHGFTEGYNFSTENYRTKGLNLITSDLGEQNDAARAYYGPIAKMPSLDQVNELVNNCLFSISDDNLIVITSRYNGNSITIRGGGGFRNLNHNADGDLRIWSAKISSETAAVSLHAPSSDTFVYDNDRVLGYNILAVHS